MTIDTIFKKLKLFLAMGVAFLLLATFTSCGGDLVGPRFQDEEEPEAEDPEKEDPSKGAGVAWSFQDVRHV